MHYEPAFTLLNHRPPTDSPCGSSTQRWEWRQGKSSFSPDAGCGTKFFLVQPRSGCFRVGRVRSRRSASERAAPANPRAQAHPNHGPEITLGPLRSASATPSFARGRRGLRNVTLRSRRARRDAPHPRWDKCHPLARQTYHRAAPSFYGRFQATSRILSHTPRGLFSSKNCFQADVAIRFRGN